jgi:hypothetical protein
VASLGTNHLNIRVPAEQRARVDALFAGMKGGASAVLSAATNDTARYAKTLIADSLREVMDVRDPKEVNKHVFVARQASKSDPTAVVAIDWQAIPLNRYGFDEVVSEGRTKHTIAGGGISATPVQGLPLLAFRSAFQKGPAGAVPIFMRDRLLSKIAPSKGRYAGRVVTRGPRKGQPILRQPLKKVFGTSAVAAFQVAPGLEAEAVAAVDAKFAERVESKIDWQLSKGTATLPPS